jgi:multicomponent Na+:H+ antiporter subunit G
MFIINEILGNLLLITGSLFLFSAGLGVLRMPDTYNRIQTGTKATTLGTILVLVGLAFLHPAWTFKLIILIFFVMLTNPVSSHALARAAHSIGIFETETTVIDQLADSNKSASIKNSDNKEVSE